MTTALLERLQVVTVEAPGVGAITRIHIPDGEPVRQGAQLGLFVGTGGMEGIKAPAAGIVRYLVKVGQPVDEGAAIATVTPVPPKPAPKAPEPRAKAPHAATRAPQQAQQPAPSPDTSKAPSPVQRVVEVHSAPPINQPAPALAVEEPRIDSRTPTPKAEAKAPQPRREEGPITVKHHTLHLSTKQIEALRKLSYRLKMEQGPQAPSQSLIARAAIEHFLNMDPATQALILEKQTRREDEGEWGSGFPRPS